MKTNRGITLVALVITIIILIILAGVTISLLVGDNGIINKAKQGKVNMQLAQQEEQEYLSSLYGDVIDAEQEGNSGEMPAGVPLPNGFYYVGGDINTGLVISDSPTDEKKGTSHEVANQLVGNQFVWIPVDDSEYQAMIDETNQRGKIYTFDDNGIGSYDENRTVLWKEPNYLTGNSMSGEGSDAGNTVGITVQSLQQEFNNMAASVKKNKGFYIARYEASLSADGTKTESKHAIPMTAQSGSGENWWQMYDKLKRLNTASTNVTTGMIWGCQWDRVMRFVNGSNDGKGTVFNVGTGNGRWNYQNLLEQCTGDIKADFVKSIYDLEGFKWEWTMQSYESEFRVMRRGDSFSAGMLGIGGAGDDGTGEDTSSGKGASHTKLEYPETTSNEYGTRQVLYVN